MSLNEIVLLLQLALGLDDRKAPYILIYVHPRGQNLLVPNKVHGKDFIILPNNPSPDKLMYGMYEIRVKKVKRMASRDLPCHEDGNPSMKECFESYYEAKYVQVPPQVSTWPIFR